MANYSVSTGLGGTEQNMTSSFKTLIALTAQTSGLKRFGIFEVVCGADGPPNATDCSIVYDISRQTAAGTATAATPNAINPADGVAVTVGAINATAEGTVTASSAVEYAALNQRATYRWAVDPNSDSVLWAPATNLAGFAIRAKSATYASTIGAKALFRE